MEKNKAKNRKNKPDNTMEIHYSKIIRYTSDLYEVHHIKTLGIPKNFLTKYINIKIVKLNYISLKILMVDELKVDMEECGVCEDCIDVCLEEAIERKAYTIIIDESKCNNCGECVDVCPVGALYED